MVVFVVGKGCGFPLLSVKQWKLYEVDKSGPKTEVCFEDCRMELFPEDLTEAFAVAIKEHNTQIAPYKWQFGYPWMQTNGTNFDPHPVYGGTDVSK